MSEKFLQRLPWLIAGAVVLIIVIGIASRSGAPGKYLSFTRCLKDKGAVFYGAFWCSHCQNTKKMFASAASELPYVECSTPDSRGQTQVCKDKKIDGYPTWIFADGERLSGELTFDTLSQKTGCSLPQQ